MLLVHSARGRVHCDNRRKFAVVAYTIIGFHAHALHHILNGLSAKDLVAEGAQSHHPLG